MRRLRRQAGLGQRPIGQGRVEVVAAQCRVAASGHHLEHALRHAQQRNVEGASAQVVHRVEALGTVVQAIGHCGGRGLVDQAQHVQARQPCRVLGGLTLSVVEVRRHRDDGAIEIVGVEAVLGALTQRGQDLGRHLHRCLDAVAGIDRDHARAVDEAVGQTIGAVDVGQCAPHQPLDRHDRVLGVVGLRRQRVVADLAPAGRQVAHGGRQQHAPLRVGQALGHAVPHRGHQRVGGAEVDPHGHAPLVRVGRLARLGNLQQGHVSVALPVEWAGRPAKRTRRSEAKTDSS